MYADVKIPEVWQVCDGRTHQCSLVGLWVFEVDDLQSERLLHFGHVSLPRRLEQRVTLKLI